MDKDLIIKIFHSAVDILVANGYDSEVYEGYSGRAMYGRETTAITTDASGAIVGWAISTAAQELAEEHGHIHPDDIFDIIPKRQDSLGLSSVYY